MDDLEAMRREYSDAGLAESDLEADPLTMFRRWFDEVRAAGVHEPNAMVVSTVSADGRPSSRIVLLKGLSDAGFVFYTNTASRKGGDLAADSRCSLLFPWHPLERQVRVDGEASPLPRQDVAAYFAGRPHGARVGAHASHQSRPVADRDELERAVADAATRWPEGEDVPVPEEWGGYVVRPDTVEFWQGRPSRLHDRLVYTRGVQPDDQGPPGWSVQRLAP